MVLAAVLLLGLLGLSPCIRAAEFRNVTFSASSSSDDAPSSSTSSASTPTITASPTSTIQTGFCPKNCSVNAGFPTTYYWQPLYFTETVIAATLVVVVNTKYNITSTSLKLNELPSGYTQPDVNAKGTHVTTIRYPRSSTTEQTILAFPTKFIWWADGYSWSGQFQSSVPGQAHNECAVATTSTFVPFESFVQPEPTMLTHSLIEDPEGNFFKATSETGVPADYAHTYSDIPAWQECQYPQVPLPMAPAFTARFMTATMTTYDDSKPSQTPQPGSSAGSSDMPKETDSQQSDKPKIPEQPEETESPKASDQPAETQSPKASENPATPGNSQVENTKQASEGSPNTQDSRPEASDNPASATGSPQESSPPPFIPVGSQTLRIISASGPAILLPDGQTLEPGHTKTIDNTPIYLPSTAGTAGPAIIVGSATLTFPPPAASAVPPQQHITLGSDTLPLSLTSLTTNALVLSNSHTLLPGSATTISGTTYSLAPSGTALIINSQTLTLPPTPTSALLLGSQTLAISAITSAPAGPGLVLPNSETLLPGSATTINGTTLSLAPSGTAIVVDGSTIPISQAAHTTAAPAYVTASGGGVVLPNGGTLRPGSQTTVDGTTYSVDDEGTLVAGSGSTTRTVGGPSGSAGAASTVASTTSQGAGPYIWQGLGGEQPAATGGTGRSLEEELRLWGASVVGVVGLVLVL